ncbi:MAG: J domain-containing protein [Geobacteraceae bacterium]|nr:J domain-containing protein [Geobacteraceae bacterium]
MTYRELTASLRTLGLGERCTLKELKFRHRELVKWHHPDSGKTDSNEAIQKINAAYRILNEYVTEYRFSFAEDEFYEQNPDERLRQQFMDSM